MKITARDYALAAAKANRENKILRMKNGTFVFEEPPVVAEDEEKKEDIKEGMDDGLGVSV